ncbi:MAG: glycine cleavage system aminomethyltransferase GcvT [Candidatus Dormibacteraeota bacterium]|nr:glycine cleavage system aminomethyltransferase GcvT [Candidatus Dormibacteraeota bacterium]
MTASPPNLTALHDRHVALGGRMVDFGGWELPQQYTSIRDEHFAVRKAAGLFDISHMGRLVVEGAGAEADLQRLLTNDLAPLAAGHAIYTLMCKEDGGVIDDLVVYRETDDRFLVVVNAANREKDTAWMRKHMGAGATVEDLTQEVSLIAFQGPQAHALLPQGSSETEAIPYFGFRSGKVAGVSALISRTGYTGEDGFELFVGSDDVGRVWDAILAEGKAAGVLPAGLGARDATRLEAALRLYGNDMDETVNPYEAGLGWTVKLGKGDFIGRAALAEVNEQGPRRTLIGFKTEPANIPRHGAAVSRDGNRVGAVTSGTHSFFLGHPIALAMIEVPSFRVGEMLSVEVRGREAPGEVVKLPFYRGSARSAVAPAKT